MKDSTMSGVMFGLGLIASLVMIGLIEFDKPIIFIYSMFVVIIFSFGVGMFYHNKYRKSIGKDEL